MPAILVTGAAGFIGSDVARRLLDEGREVVGVDNLNDAYDERLKEWRLARLRGRPGFTFRRADISTAEGARQAWGGEAYEAVINLAARAGVRPSLRHPGLYYATNVLGTLHLLDLCREHRVPKFVLASTSSLYGAHNPRPFQETADITRPFSPYAASKGAAELLCHTYHHLYGLDVSVLRYFTVYGPAGRPDMSIFRFVQWIAEDRPVLIYGDGTQERDFTYRDDVSAGTVAALRPLGYEVINLGSDRPIPLTGLIERIEGRLGKKARVEHRPPAPGDVPSTWADITKAGRLLAWEPATSLDDGLGACVRWYLDEREWARQVNTLD
ncbi:MAG TPA: NAD-dependent epimerase/dehydratase family protein [Anaerolineales bacterium]|nr:NAD-dependent epimerase/dehydratase family protein [Anaerolineales bacterium]